MVRVLVGECRHFWRTKQLLYYLNSLLLMHVYIHVHIVYTFNYADGGPIEGNSSLPSSLADDPSPEVYSASHGMCTDIPNYYNHESSKFHAISEC